MQIVDQHARLQRAQLAWLDHDRTASGDGRSQLETNEQRVLIPSGYQTSDADRLHRHRHLVPVACPRYLVKRLFGGGKRIDTRFHNQTGKLGDATVLLDHCGCQIVDSGGSGLMQPTQDIRSLFLRRLAEGGERAFGGGNGASRIFLVSQRYAADDFPVGWTNNVHDFAAVGSASARDAGCGRRSLPPGRELRLDELQGRIADASRIVVIDIQPKRLEAAKKFGATDVIDSTTTKPVEAVRDLLHGGADHVFDFVGLKAVAEQGLAMLGVGGGLYLVGVSKPEVSIDLNIFDAIGGQKRVQGVNFGSTNFKRDIPMYADFYLQGWMNLDDLVSKKIALREVNDGYAALKDGSLNRVVVTSF